MDKGPKGILENLKNIFSKNDDTDKSKKITKYAIFILVLGIALMVFGSLGKQKEDGAVPTMESHESEDKSNDDQSSPVFGQDEENEPETMTEFERRFENELKEALETISGVDDATVMINIDETAVKVYEKNATMQQQTTTETDSEGGKRDVKDISTDEQLVILRNGDQEVPVLVKEIKPAIRGVLVVARGAEDIQVKKMILEAVTKVLDVPVHKVSVLPKKLEEES